VPFWLLALFILQFFPRSAGARSPTSASGAVPGDGRIVEVSRAHDPYANLEALKVSVFMNVFNVHSNRSPVDCVVKERWYFRGPSSMPPGQGIARERAQRAAAAHAGREGRHPLSRSG